MILHLDKGVEISLVAKLLGKPESIITQKIQEIKNSEKLVPIQGAYPIREATKEVLAQYHTGFSKAQI